jgi:hypothetical protein
MNLQGCENFRHNTEVYEVSCVRNVKCICSCVGYQTVETDIKYSRGCVSGTSGDSDAEDETLVDGDCVNNDTFV